MLSLLHLRLQLPISQPLEIRPFYSHLSSSPKARVASQGELLPSSLCRDSMPRHVAVIMDGNARWARKRGLPLASGHAAGVRAVKEVVNLSCRWGISVLTLFAFSSDNWLRPKTEVEFLMSLFQSVLKAELDYFVREGIQLHLIGDPLKLPKSLRNLVHEAVEITRNNNNLKLIVAVGYSGRRDIVQACQKIAQKVKDGLLEPADITESLIEQELETNCSIDLLIRTSGELRLSNFLLWQLAYSELFFADSLWPDFGEVEFVEAIRSFQHRQRRFGKRCTEV